MKGDVRDFSAGTLPACRMALKRHLFEHYWRQFGFRGIGVARKSGVIQGVGDWSGAGRPGSPEFGLLQNLPVLL